MTSCRPTCRNHADPILAGLDEQRALLYHDLVLTALGPAARRALEALMATEGYEFLKEFPRKYISLGRSEGMVTGKAEAVLAILAARGIDVSSEARERILDCDNLVTLDQWIARAVSASSVDEVLA